MLYPPVFKNRLLPWVLLMPTLFILLVFLYYPTLQSIVLSFYRSNLFLGTRKFIGLENYRNIFGGPLAPSWYQALFQTLMFCVVSVSLGVGVSAVIANLANLPIRGIRVYRLLLIWPFALSPAMTGTIFLFLFNPEVGLVNDIFGFLFRLRPRWLDDPGLAFALVCLGAVWKNLGYNLVFYLAALQNMPKHINEAAEIDGAGGIRRFFAVILPYLSPITFFLIFTNLTYTLFEAFAIVDILTRGGPVGPEPFDAAGVTTTLVYKVFQDGFGGSSNMGFAAAQSVLLIALAGVFTVLQFRTGGSRVYYGENG